MVGKLFITRENVSSNLKTITKIQIIYKIDTDLYVGSKVGSLYQDLNIYIQFGISTCGG